MSAQEPAPSSAMMIEVELKFAVGDREAAIRAIELAGAVAQDTERQRDLYFNHPVRDFAQTDEALRIRMTDGLARVTFKGPRIDRDTKSRREIELAFAGDETAGDQFGEILELLDFQPVMCVSKRRTRWYVPCPSGAIDVAVDDVEGLGTFVELERAVPSSEFEVAKREIQALAARLELTRPEHRSYLRLILEKSQNATPAESKGGTPDSIAE